MRMAGKSPIQKLQEAVVDAVSGVVADPKGSVGKAAGQVRGVVSLGLTVAGHVAGHVADRLAGGHQAPPPYAGGRPDLRVAEPSTSAAEADEPVVTPSDVARVVAKKAPPRKRAAAPSTPSDKLPPRKAPAKKAPAKKAPAKKAPAKKAAAKKTQPTAAEVLEDTSVTTPVGTTGADVATNPSTTDTGLQQVGTEPLMDPATTKAVASEARIGARAADPDKG